MFNHMLTMTTNGMLVETRGGKYIDLGALAVWTTSKDFSKILSYYEKKGIKVVTKVATKYKDEL